MPGRKFSQPSNIYRYGFNGQEKSTEIAEGLTTAMYWEYDSRIGRRWNLDPKPTTKVSNYSAFFNNPIFNFDVHGDTAITPLQAFKSLLPYALGPGGKTVAKAIPNNATGNRIAGAVVGSGQAMIDGMQGVYNTVRHPINTIVGVYNFLTADPTKLTINLSQQYINSVNVNGVSFTNSYLVSYAFTSFVAAKYMPSLPGLVSDVSEVAANAIKFTRFKGGGTYAEFQGKNLGWYQFSKEKGLQLDLNIPAELQGKGFGTQIFSDAMKQTGAKKFTATWIESTDYATGASVNLERYRAALSNSTATEAAWKTWSGQQAAANGFKNVTVKSILSGTGIEATFTK